MYTKNNFHVYIKTRHCNSVAYSLARLAILNPQLLVWMEDVPLDVHFVLWVDLDGLS